jgi:hypothetical protein
LDNLGERQAGKITVLDVRQYLVYLLTEYQPRRISGNTGVKQSPKNVRNVWVTIAAFFPWASDELEIRQSNPEWAEFIDYNNPVTGNS